MAAIALALVAGPRVLIGQITVNSTSSGSTAGATSLTWSHTIAAGSNRALFVGISMEDGGGSSVTYGGTAMTLVGSTGSSRIAIWRLLAPPVGTANIVSTFGTTKQVVGGAAAFDGVHQTTPNGTFASSNNTSTTPSVTVSSAVGELVIDALYANDGPTAAAGAGQTVQWNLATGSGNGTVRGTGSTEAGAASVTMSWTLSSSVEWRIGGVSIKPAAATTTTLGNGTDPGNASLAPGGAATMADAFTLQTSSGTDAITAVTVTLAAGTSGGLSLVEITNDAGTTVYGSVTNPGSDTPAITLTTNISATTTSTQYKVRVTPKSHANMPAPAGSSYALTARISAWTGTNTQAGSDAAGTTVTIDNLSPGNVTASTATAGSAQVALSWTNPGDVDLASIVVLRRATSAVADVPVEGATYTVGNAIGASTVACVVTAPTASCTDTGLTNGTTFHYKSFAKDANENYATGVVPTGSPATPNPAISGNAFEDVNYGGGAGRSKAASSGTSRNSARVELYTSGGVYSTFATTDVNGDYSFTNVPAGTYYVRVVNSSVSSSRTGYTSAALAVQSYRTDATTGSAVAVTDYVGGTNPAAADPGNGSAGATFNTSTFVYSAVLSGTAQSVAPVVVWSANITGLDFGFNFNSVVNTNNSGQGSLRQFIDNANLLGGDASLAQAGLIAAKDNAVFIISNGTAGSGLRSANNYFSGGIATISPNPGLPTVSTPMVIDAQTQPGWSTTPIIELNGSSAGATQNGLTVSAGASIIRGFIINRFTNNGIYLITSGADTVQGNYVGINSAGIAVSANTLHGIFANNIANTLIGGTSAAARNVVSGNNYGIVIAGASATGNTVSGNYVGLNAAGTAALANSLGIDIEGAATGNTIGGTSVAARNVASGNTQMGVLLQNAGTSSNTVAGNYIGTNAAGTAAVPNGTHGVNIKNSASGNTVGGTTGTAGNVVSGNTGSGIAIEGAAASGNIVLGNYVGLNSAGTTAIANALHGVYVLDAPSNRIGGTTASARNVISGNSGSGVYVLGATASGNAVKGNYVGTNAAGTAAVANAVNGIWLEAAPNDTIGGTADGAGNVISGNTNHGVWLYGATSGTLVRGNRIGTNAAGTAPVPNQVHGVALTLGASSNTIGGTTASARNVISGNATAGLVVLGATTTGNVIQGNSIGADSAGTTALGNGTFGVFVDAVNTSVGGTTAGASNLIANNGADGVAVVNVSTGNGILTNSIYANVGLGIDLADNNITTNNGTKNAGLPNSDMDFPVFTAAVLNGTTLTVSGYVGSAPSQSTFAAARVELFKSSLDVSGNGEGQAYLGFLTADASGNFSGSVTVSGLSLGDKLTGTATDGSNNTSEFGANVTVTSTTTLATGTDPGNASIAPSGAATMADAFTFQTASGTDAITAATVTLATGTSGGLSLVEITNDAGTVVYGSVANPGSDTPAITLTTNITATTTLTQYKIRVTPMSHVNMPAPVGSSYAVTARISAWTGANAQAGSDAAGTTVTVDNLSPGNVTASTATAGLSQVSLAWTNPGDADLSAIIVLRRTTSVVTDTPVEGTTYTVGTTIGSSTVACVVTSPTASCTDTGLTNGTTYYYKIFAKDANGNYATGAVPTGSPATPLATTLATGTDPGNTSIAPGGAATMADAFTLQTASGTDAITAVTVTLATGTSAGLSLVEITNDAGTVVYGSVANPGSDTPAITFSTNITATTMLTQYKIRITPRTHANMPAPSGASYAVTALISAWTGTNGQAGSDAAGTTVTIDNLSPGNVTASTATAGIAQVSLAWTNPGDADLSSIVVLRRTTSVVTDTPVEGTTYTVGNTVGSSTVACVITAPTASCTDTGLTNGTAYYYRIFARDANDNYATGAVPTGSPATPAAPLPNISGTIFEDVNYGGGAGRSKATSSGVGRSGARVELYTSAGVYSTFTTTDVNGDYTFSALSASTYYVRVVNSTMTSSRTGYTASALAVQTYRTDATTGAAVAVTDFVGGTNPAVADPGNGSAGATFNTTTFVYSAVLSGTAQLVIPVVVAAANITGLDAGFNFDAIVNTNNTGQGSLRQFLANANLLNNTGLAQSGRTAGIDNAIWMISNGTAAAGLRASNNYFSGGVATVAPTSALPPVTDPVVMDAQTQPGWTSAPLVQLSGTSAGVGAKGLEITAGSSTVRGFAINAFTGNANSAGIWLSTAGSNTIQGNYLGTNAAGTASSANYQGIQITTASNTIGGSAASQRNVVSGNTFRGILLDNAGGSANNNIIRGNYIGTNAAGTAALANSIGIYLSDSPNNIIGGTANGEGNVTSGNTNFGIYFVSTGTTGNLVQGNTIGLNAARSAAVPNGSSGIEICCSGSTVMNNTIGGTVVAAANVISGNTGRGVHAQTGSGNAILGNSIYGNGGIGIDLGNDNVTANDGAKPAGTPNLQMDFPVFTSALLNGTTLTVLGYVGSAPSQSTFASARVEIFKSDLDASGNGEGQTYLGFLTADASGNISGALSGVSGLSVGDKITATATDAGNNTSEFGANLSVAAPVPTLTLAESVTPSGTQPPGTDLAYTTTFTNAGTAAALSVVITDPIPPNTDFKVGSVTQNLGTTGLSVVVASSNNGGSTWTYTPVSGAGGAPAGYDRLVTNIKWTFTGNLSQTAPNNSGTTGATVRIR